MLFYDKLFWKSSKSWQKSKNVLWSIFVRFSYLTKKYSKVVDVFSNVASYSGSGEVSRFAKNDPYILHKSTWNTHEIICVYLLYNIFPCLPSQSADSTKAPLAAFCIYVHFLLCILPFFALSVVASCQRSL